MNILIAGGMGFVGRSLTQYLVEKEHHVTVLTRNVERWRKTPTHPLVSYDSWVMDQWKRTLKDHRVIINLAGTSIFRFWNHSGKTAIYNSRILTTRDLVDTLTGFASSEITFINFSGIGYYGFGGDEVLDENHPSGHDFLARVARDWESEALRAANSGFRVVLCRLGHVLGYHGGVLKKLYALSKYNLGGYWGDGRQWFSWIHEADIAQVIFFLLEENNISGPVNLSTPLPVRNRDLMEILNRLTENRPLLPRIPAWLLRTCMGELSSLFLTGQRVMPALLEKQGFIFQHPSLENALKCLLKCKP